MFKEKAKSLSNEEIEYYSRQLVLSKIGYDGQLKLKNAKICIVGLGGLGSPAAFQLAAMGVGYLRLVDYDIVEISNLQRQYLYDINSIGYPKVEIAAKKLHELNPNIEIEPLPLSLNVNTAEEIVKGMDVIIDGLDNISSRYALNRACIKNGIPYIFATAIMMYGYVSTIIPNKTPCLECFQGNIEDDALPTCAIVGVHPSILNIIASIEVSEAIRIILGEKPYLINKLLYCDIENTKFTEIGILKSEKCPICSSNPSSSPIPLKHKLITEVCGREGKRTFIIVPKENLELNIDKLHNILINNGFDIKIKANLGITFRNELKVKASILKSGIMVIEGYRKRERSL